MNVVVAPVLAVIFGLSVRSRFRAVVLYLVIQSLFFTLQTLVVLLSWMGGEGGFGGATDQGAFGPAPTGFPVAFESGEVFAYGLVNLALIGVGIVIMLGVAALRRRRAAHRETVQVAD